MTKQITTNCYVNLKLSLTNDGMRISIVTCACQTPMDKSVWKKTGVVADAYRTTTQRRCAGFGYDPLFIIREYHQTFGELDLTVKRAISHRSRALRKFIPRLLRLIEQES